MVGAWAVPTVSLVGASLGAELAADSLTRGEQASLLAGQINEIDE